MNRGWLVVLTGCLVLGFQNCSQANLSQSGLSGSSSQLVSPSVGVGSDADESSVISSLEIPVRGGILSVDPKSGHILLIDDNQKVVEESCLPQAEISELQAYLKTSNVCGPKTSVAADAQCGQVYTAGYASLIIGDQKMNLGESFDSCGRGYKDICGDQAQSFRGLVSYIQKNFHGLLCEQ